MAPGRPMATTVPAPMPGRGRTSGAAGSGTTGPGMAGSGMDPPRYGRFRDGRAGRPDRAVRPDRHPRPGGTTQARLSITTAGVQSGCGQIRAVTGPRIYPPANRGAMFLRFPGERPA
jgi:hypothetical protein